MVNEIRRGGLNEIRRGVEMPLRGSERHQAGQTCSCGRTFSTTQQVHQCACGVLWVSQQAVERSAAENRTQGVRTVTTTTPRKAYTMTEAREQAVAERDACWSVIERKAAEIQGPRKLTKAAAITAVLSEDRGLYHRYNELQNIDHRAGLTFEAMAGKEPMSATEELDSLNAEIEAAAALYQQAHPGTTHAVAYTEAMKASEDFRRRYVELSRGVAA